MADINDRYPVDFHELKWDTDFFKVSCAKAILHRPLVRDEWESVKKKFIDYQFISIENRNSEPINAQLIGKETDAFLADVNLQFTKRLEEEIEKPENITIYNHMDRNEQIIGMAEFQFSKFIEDTEFAKRNGSLVYEQWLINAFNKPDKYFAMSQNVSGETDGFLLHSFSDNICTIELLAVTKDKVKKGIGTSLFRMVEYETKHKGYDEIRVGTMIRNLGAVNFYHSMGCKQVGCHQIYHLWRL